MADLYEMDEERFDESDSNLEIMSHFDQQYGTLDELTEAMR